MPITEDERVLFYEAAEIPFATTVTYVDGRYGTTRREVDYAITTSRTEIDTRLDALGAPELSRLQGFLARWQAISYKDTSIEPMGANEGVRQSYARERSILRRRILMLVGVVLEKDSHASGIPLG